MSEGKITATAPSADGEPPVPLNDGKQGHAVIAMGDEAPSFDEPEVVQMQKLDPRKQGGTQAELSDPNTGKEDVKGIRNDVRLALHCCWRWKASVCILLFIPYWIGALYWDHKSLQNHEKNPDNRHYSSAFISGIAAFIFVYILHHYYRKLLCKNLDEWGRSDGTLRRPDMWLRKFIVDDLTRNSQLMLSFVCVGGWFAWVAVECGESRERWQCLIGLVFFVLLSWIISYKPGQVKWRPVLWGLFLQWIFGYIVLTTTWGHDAFQEISDQVTTFLGYTQAGSRMVFAGIYTEGGTWSAPTAFAFEVLPTVVFFSSFVYLLYWMGVLQKCISFIAYWMQITLGTSASESLSAAGNIFVGQTEAPLLVRPFLKDMTESEIHAIMTGGFATIAGGVLAAYIGFGISAHHLLSASIMSAPAALAISKIVYPETEESATANGKRVEVSSLSEASGPLDAITKGASISIPLVANIAAMLITFTALIEFLNEVVAYFGERVGIVGPPEDDRLTFTRILGWLLYPIAWLIGSPSKDCEAMGELLGIKVIVNEFIAYEQLKVKYCNNEISDRGLLIATYALCGFANFSSIGIQLGGLGPLAPNKKEAMQKVVFRAMIAGNIACFMTACVAGILTKDAVPNMDCSQISG